MYLLDTNHCTYIINGSNPNILNKIASTSIDKLSICVIIEGELILGARYSARPDENLPTIRRFISSFSQNYSIDSKVADVYGVIKADLLKRFGPREKAKRRNFKIQQLGISDNDLWIASIALKNDLMLLSQDSDFTKISQVCDLRVSSWL